MSFEQFTAGPQQIVERLTGLAANMGPAGKQDELLAGQKPFESTGRLAQLRPPDLVERVEQVADDVELVVDDLDGGAVGLEAVAVGLPHVHDGMGDESGPGGAEPTPELAEVFLLAAWHDIEQFGTARPFQGADHGPVGLASAHGDLIDSQHRDAVQGSPSLDGITVLGVDEIAVGRGQTYWTMISALEGPRGPELLNVVPGRKEKDLGKFWRWFGAARARLVTHAVMDMWKPYRNSFKAHCPGVQIIYDKFHVICHLLDALNKVRRTELGKAVGRFKGLLAGKKFILLSRRAHVRGKAREALNDLLGASRKLLKAHLLKESFNHLWSYKSKTCARR